MRSDRDTLLEAIRAAPDDDAPRLVYADWLEEQGDAEHAELIRVQRRLQGLPDGAAEAKPLTAQARKLKRRLTARLKLPGGVKVEWQDGCVVRVTTGLLNYLDCSEHLARYAPALELILQKDDRDKTVMNASSATKVKATLARFTACEALSACVSLDLSWYWPGEAVMTAVLQSSHLRNLRALNAPENDAGSAIEGVASPTFANLTWLNLRHSCAFEDAELAAIVLCPHLTKLEYLDFSVNDQDDRGLHALVASQSMTHLRHLNMSYDLPTRDGLVALCHARNLPALTELNLTCVLDEESPEFRGDDLLVELARSPLAEQLTHVWLEDNSITEDGARALAESPRPLRLQFIGLDNNHVGPAGRKALRARFGAQVLTSPRRRGGLGSRRELP
jgi:uncharacterized protein (TIGR02996 family)